MIFSYAATTSLAPKICFAMFSTPCCSSFLIHKLAPSSGSEGSAAFLPCGPASSSSICCSPARSPSQQQRAEATPDRAKWYPAQSSPRATPASGISARAATVFRGSLSSERTSQRAPGYDARDRLSHGGLQSDERASPVQARDAGGLADQRRLRHGATSTISCRVGQTSIVAYGALGNLDAMPSASCISRASTR